jgi:hypothetical protein
MPPAASAKATSPSDSRPLWQVPLLVGVCFGLGYGVTQRLLSLQLPSLVRLGQGFEVRPFPGTTLESLRLRFGAEDQDIRGDADPLQLDQQSDAEAQPAPEMDAELNEAPSLNASPQSQSQSQSQSPPAPSPALPPPPDLPGADLPQSIPAVGPQ